MVSRRRFLQLGLSLPVTLSLGASGLAQAAPQRRGPRYVVFLVLGGGFDPVYTTDPRTLREVDNGVDVPFEKSAILERGARRFGPHFASLADDLSRCTILNGVRTNTAAHDIGMMQLIRLKTNAVRRMPSFLDLVGSVRDGQPVGAVTLSASDIFYSSGWFGTSSFYDAADYQTDSLDIFDRIAEQSPDEQRMIARAVLAKRKSIAMTTSDRALLDQLDANAALWNAAPAWPRFTPEKWSDDPGLPRRLQRATWILENDIARGVLVDVDTVSWDTHEQNAVRQTANNEWAMPSIARFLRELGKRKNRYGTLAEQTLVIVSTEMGRMPFLNHRHGKDHLPQIPVALFGPGLRPDTFGVCGRQMEALDVSPITGKGGAHRLMLDDVGVSLLRHCGVDPAPYGYLGEQLDFLFA